jgi:hypothetical protein
MVAQGCPMAVGPSRAERCLPGHTNNSGRRVALRWPVLSSERYQYGQRIIGVSVAGVMYRHVAPGPVKYTLGPVSPISVLSKALSLARLACPVYAGNVAARLSRAAKPNVLAVSRAWSTNPVASSVLPTSRRRSA